MSYLIFKANFSALQECTEVVIIDRYGWKFLSLPCKEKQEVLGII